VGVKKTAKKFWAVKIPRKYWKWEIVYSCLNPYFKVSIRCPKCKQWSGINGRFVSADGLIERIVECLHKRKPKRAWPHGDIEVCGFNGHIRLAQWNKEIKRIVERLEKS
jgi:hypothetical protein